MGEVINSEETRARYNQLKTFRDPYLNRAYNYARVTLPYLLNQNEDNSSSEVQLDYNSVGAEYTNHLANRYMQELFPAARSFFKLQLDDAAVVEQEQVTGKNKSEQDKALTAGERKARWKFEKRHAREPILDGLKHCIVSGNACLYWPDEDDKNVQLYALDEYVLLRSPDGKLLELILEDKKAILTLDPEIRSTVMSQMDLDPDQDLSQVKAKLYTHVRIDPEDPTKYHVAQAVEETPVGEPSEYPAHLLPWMPLVWNRTRREMYGRGLVEDHYGAFYALSVLTEAIVTGSAIMTDFKFLVRPGSILDVVAMNAAASGTYHYGDPDDVHAVETGKVNDFKFIFDIIQWYKQTLGKAFLSLSSQMRDAERVTAEENRMRAMELETAHGGVFSNFSLTLQKPVAERLMRDIEVDIKGSAIEPVIVTGLDAMGRTADNEKMILLFQDLSQLQNVPEEIRGRIKPSELVILMANGRDVDVDKCIMTEEEYVKQVQDQRQMVAGDVAGQEMLKKASAEQIAEGMQGQQQGG